MNEISILKIVSGLTAQSVDQDTATTLKQNHAFASKMYRIGTQEANKTLLFALEDETAAILVEFLILFHAQTGDFPKTEDLQPSLVQAGLVTEQVTRALALMARANSSPVTSSGIFSVWVIRSLDFAGRVSLSDDLIKAMKILESTELVDGVRLSGTVDACAFLENSIAEHRSRIEVVSVHRGDIRGETDIILGEIDSAKRGDFGEVLYTGYRAIDSRTNGLNLGDLVMVGASTNEGKSQMCHNIGYNMATMFDKNILVITLETSRSIYRRRLFTRHTHKFLRGGVKYDNIKTGQLDDREAKAVLETAENWRSGIGGVIEVVKLSAPTINDIAAEVQSFNAKYDKPVDGLIVDYLKLMRAARSRKSRREEVEQILEEAKQLAGKANSGGGTVLIAAHQMKTEAREKARPEDGKFYTIRDFADTSEVGKSADRALVLLRTDELKKEHELAAALVKDRDADVSGLFKLFEDFSTSMIGSLSEDEEVE